MTKKSAGVLAYRFKNKIPEVLLAHPGGPFFAKKDLGAWTIPKGEFEEDEEPLAAAKREFHEEVGTHLSGTFTALTPIIQKSGKKVFAWALETDIDPDVCTSNTFNMEWPPRSGKFHDFPEIDKVAWFTIPGAKQKINPSQVPLIDELVGILNLGE